MITLDSKRHQPKFDIPIYGATKVFNLYLSQGMNFEFNHTSLDVQAVLAVFSRTDLSDQVGVDINTMTDEMDVGDLVDVTSNHSHSIVAGGLLDTS